jgi:glycosyltransferase involved in cell wall biosynthesis
METGSARLIARRRSTARPEVSVVIPTRDRWPRLSLTLDSVLAQEGVEFEVIVVDDGSKDGSSQEVAAYGDPRISVLRHDISEGVSRARNTGAANAQGDWIGWLDDDDLWAPDKLRLQLEAGRQEHADFIYSDAIVFDPERGIVDPQDAPDAAAFAARIRVENEMPGGCSNVLAAASLVRRVGGFDPALRFVADWDYWIRCAGIARPAVVRQPLVARVAHADNMVVRENTGLLAELDHFLSKHAHGEERRRMHAVSFCRSVAADLRRGGRRLGAVRLFLRAALRYRRFGHVLTALRMAFGEWAVDLRQSQRRSAAPRPPWLARYETHDLPPPGSAALPRPLDDALS